MTNEDLLNALRDLAYKFDPADSADDLRGAISWIEEQFKDYVVVPRYLAMEAIRIEEQAAMPLSDQQYANNDELRKLVEDQ